MKKLLFPFVAALLVATASLASERSQMSASGPTVAARNRAPQAQEMNDEMQALCREVLVDIDQGYGISSHESRYICDDKTH